MVKKAASFVLASLGTSTYRKTYVSVSRSLRPPAGAARVSARAGWAGEKAAFLTILERVLARNASVLVLMVGVWSIADAADWSTIAESRFLYTDNVFELSAARRLSLGEDPSQPTIVPANKPSDVVWEPSVDVRRTSTSSLGTTEFSAKAHGFVYTDHSIFNHGNYRLQLKQHLSSDTSVLLRYRYIPNLFLGPNIERRSGNRLIEEERVTSHIWRVQAEHRLTDAWTVTGVARYGLRLFNEVFAQRDTTFWTVGPQAAWRTSYGPVVTLA